MVMVIAGIVAVSAASAWAGGACCAKGKKASCVDKMSSLNLTEEQKAKITELEQACKKACDEAGGYSKEACAKMDSDVRAVLTEEQAAQWDEICGAKKAKGNCGG
jgi:Spy/CpxP family protein refolding chaperone